MKQNIQETENEIVFCNELIAAIPDIDINKKILFKLNQRKDVLEKELKYKRGVEKLMNDLDENFSKLFLKPKIQKKDSDC